MSFFVNFSNDKKKNEFKVKKEGRRKFVSSKIFNIKIDKKNKKKKIKIIFWNLVLILLRTKKNNAKAAVGKDINGNPGEILFCIFKSIKWSEQTKIRNKAIIKFCTKLSNIVFFEKYNLI
ncbi:MAG: hypothetical protein KDK36_13425 [Leptospiraceae bacterium]|nr:hypothetical protein [Leptospiraceae bacterium]